MILCGPNTKTVQPKLGSPIKTPKEVTSSVVIDLGAVVKIPIILTTWANSHPGQIGQTYLGREPQLHQIYSVSGDGIGLPRVSTFNKFGMEMCTNSHKIEFGQVEHADTTMTVCFVK